MLFDGFKSNDYKISEDSFSVNNYQNILSFLINENNIMSETLLLDIYPLMEEALLYEDTIMLSESIADNIDLSIKSLKKTLNKVEELWKNFLTDHETNRLDAAKLVTKALISDDNSKYTYHGYKYNIKYDNIYIDHSLVSNLTLASRQVEQGRTEQLKSHYDSPNFYNKIRGQFILKPLCSADDFPRELKRFYRCGKDEPEDIQMDDKFKEEIIDSIFYVDDTLTNCRSIKESILSYGNTALKYLENLRRLVQVSKNGMLKDSGITYNLSDIEELALVQAKNIRAILNIYITVFTVKMDMSNERQRSYTQALKDMTKGGGN